jgi:surface polysaccharide O-acyltransferase-like enzyme
MTASRRNIGFDLIRIIAILMVLYNHREAYGYSVNFPYMGYKYVLEVFASALCKCGSALFFMVSGALLLGRQEPVKRIFTHRILRILIAMAAMAVLSKVQEQRPESLLTLFTSGLNWYLYSYLAYLIMLPFLRILAQHMTRDDRKLFFLISVIAYMLGGILLPFAGLRENLTGAMTLFTSGWASNCWQLTFPVIGYILVKLSEEEKDAGRKRTIKLLLLSGAVFSLILCLLLVNYDMKFNGGANLEQIRQRSVLLPSCFLVFALYDSARNWNVSGPAAALIRNLSAATFGIFLIDTHTTYSQQLFEIALRCQPFAGRYVCSILSILLEFTVYFLAVYLLRKLPGIKEIL